MSFLTETLEFKEFNQNQLKEIELPTIKEESWKYTNLARLYPHAFAVSSESETPEKIQGNIETLKIYGSKFEGEFKLGSLVLRASSEDEMSRFSERSHYFSEEFLSKLINAAPTLFISLEQTDKKSAPALVEFYNAKEEQVNIVLLSQEITDQAVMFKFSGKGQYHVHALGNIEENKSFEHVFLQDMEEAGIFFLESHYELARDARYSQVVVQKGGALTRLNISAKLNGENAEADMHGLYTPKGKSHFDVSSYIEHAAPHNYSRQVYKGIIDDQSKGIFAGKVKVNKGSLLITAEQLNKNLLLTPKAQAFSRPQMEIDADDVKCAHGSTTGQLSEKELFYFESRGIRRDKARAMLAQGFAMDVILKTKNETIRNLLIENL